jgi:hypothetical protein
VAVEVVLKKQNLSEVQVLWQIMYHVKEEVLRAGLYDKPTIELLAIDAIVVRLVECH